MQDEAADEFFEGESACGSSLDHGIRHGFVGEAEGAAESIRDEMLCQAAHECFLVAGEFIAELEEPLERGSVGQGAARVDRVLCALPDGVARGDLGVLCVSPQSDGVEVFQTEPDGVNFPVTLSALRFLHMCGEQFAGGEQFACVAAQLGNVWRRGGWGLVEKFSQDPSAALHRRGSFPIGAHCEDCGHSWKASARGSTRHWH